MLDPKITRLHTRIFSWRFWILLNQNELPLTAARIFITTLYPDISPWAHLQLSVTTVWSQAGAQRRIQKNLPKAVVLWRKFQQHMSLKEIKRNREIWVAGNKGKILFRSLSEQRSSALPLQQSVLPDTRPDVLSQRGHTRSLHLQIVKGETPLLFVLQRE